MLTLRMGRFILLPFTLTDVVFYFLMGVRYPKSKPSFVDMGVRYPKSKPLICNGGAVSRKQTV